MNKKLYNRLISISKAMKPELQNGERFHTSFIIKNSKIISIGWNNYDKNHNSNKFGRYAQTHKFSRDTYKPCIHAEPSSIVKFDGSIKDLRRHKMVVIRIDNNGNPAMSKPCENCQKMLEVFRPKAVFYSNEQGECQELDLN